MYMARNLLLEGLAVGGLMLLLFLILQRVFPRLPPPAVVAAAGLTGHLGLEALGLNAAFCRYAFASP